jgi:hypothetical protein
MHKLATRFFIRRPVQGHGVRPYVERALQEARHGGGADRRTTPVYPIACVGLLYFAVIWFATGSYAPW